MKFIAFISLLFSSVMTFAQCYTKEVKNGVEMLKGSSEYIYARTDSSYLGMLFTVIKKEDHGYNIEITYDSTEQLTAPDSLTFNFEDGSEIPFILKKTKTLQTIIDGYLQRRIIILDIPANNVTAVLQRKLKYVSSHSGDNTLTVPIYDEFFLKNQFNCLGN